MLMDRDAKTQNQKNNYNLFTLYIKYNYIITTGLN